MENNDSKSFSIIVVSRLIYDQHRVGAMLLQSHVSQIHSPDKKQTQDARHQVDVDWKRRAQGVNHK
jgi:hypothetical protein